jgi:Fe-S cluster assembly protein SufD
MNASSNVVDPYVSAFERRRDELVPAALPWLASMRASAIEQFSRIGFPGAKNEDWKYTNPGELVKTTYASPRSGDEVSNASIEAAVAALPIDERTPLVVLVDGRYTAELSRAAADEVRVQSLAALLAADPQTLEGLLGGCLDASVHGFAALNAAFATDGAVIRVAEGRAVERPIHVLHYTSDGGDPVLAHVRNVIVAEAGSIATVVEHYAGDGAAANLVNAVSEIRVGADARLDHLILQNQPRATSHIERVEVRQDRASTYASLLLTLGAALSRTEIRVLLDGERAQCELDGVYALDGDQHGDHHTLIDHVRPTTSSRELYKGVVDGDARGVFTGRVIVRPDAQQIQAHQTNRNLLLSEGAVAEARPQLEIYADDVKCSHGCTVGQLDEASMFYLRQRGIDAVAARRLLTTAFAGEVLEEIADEPLRVAAEAALAAKIGTEQAVIRGIEAS